MLNVVFRDAIILLRSAIITLLIINFIYRIVSTMLRVTSCIAILSKAHAAVLSCNSYFILLITLAGDGA